MPPSEIRDYTCGTRTYDTSAGYNHRGTDYFIWPFPWHLMDTAPVDIRAAVCGFLGSSRSSQSANSA